MIPELAEKIQSRIVVAWDCWIWPGTSQGNYGEVTHNGERIVGAHRASWLAHNGPIPDGLWVLHRCNNKYCVNPTHLYIGTPSDNVRDVIASGNHFSLYRGATHCKRGHPFTPENTVRQWSGRHCKRCKYDWEIKKNRRLKDAGKAAQ